MPFPKCFSVACSVLARLCDWSNPRTDPGSGSKLQTPANTIHSPQYQKWSLQAQQSFGTSTSLTIGYFGNHGIHELVQKPNANAFGFASSPQGEGEAALPGRGPSTLSSDRGREFPASTGVQQANRCYALNQTGFLIQKGGNGGAVRPLSPRPPSSES